MENGIINVLIVDDEQIIRQGLKSTIDWTNNGFRICGESSTGEDAVEKIRMYQPDLVLLDIRMPKMYGTELIEIVRKEGFAGDFIILSGYSDFKYVQTALHNGASFYLTKPIDEHELLDAVLSVKEKILKRTSEKNSLIQYASKAKISILHDLILSDSVDYSIDYESLGLSSYIYQLVMYESYTPYYTSYSFADILRVANQGNQAFEHIQIDEHEVIILKGAYAIEKFNSCLEHYRQGTEKGSPLDILFLTYGPTINSLNDLRDSYFTCNRLMKRRFFCHENQHVLSYSDLPNTMYSESSISDFSTDSKVSKTYSDKLVNYIQSYNRRCITELLDELSNQMYVCNLEVNTIKYFLIDIFLQIKQAIAANYISIDIPFAHNAAIIESLSSKYYLHEIMTYFNEQFEMIMRAIGNSSSDSVLDDILYYISHNYQKSLRLESLASLFGYNSSYLGKLFKDKTGQNFNAYMDNVRIENAKNLLCTTTLKIYEISMHVGFKNVDYFQQKFKNIVGTNPTEYRNSQNK